MTVLALEDIVKSIGERVLLDRVSLNINEDDKIGLIGANGTGKSSLLNIISGQDAPESGVRSVSRGMALEYLPQEPEFDPMGTVMDQVINRAGSNLIQIAEYQKVWEELSRDPDNQELQNRLSLLGQQINDLDAWHLESQVKTVLTKLGISEFGVLMGDLSGGQKKRVALARALVSPCDLLLLDEPTNHLDNEMVEWLEKYLQARKGALIMVTHDRYFLDRVVGKIVELDKGKLYTYNGNYDYYLEKKLERQSIDNAVENKRYSLYKKELQWMRTGARARTTKQKARIQRFEELKDSLTTADDSRLEFSAGHSRLGKKTIEMDRLSKSFAGTYLIRDFSYLLLRDDRVGIIGPNGAGKSTLLKLITSQCRPDSGRIVIGPTVKIAYLAQESEDMDQTLRSIDYIKGAAEYITTTQNVRISAAQMMERFLFPRDLQWTTIARLSGGEKRRLYLLKILMESPNVLLLDEPTNDLDIDTLTVLEDYLDDFPGAVMVVSHDRYFLDRVCYRILSFEGDGRVQEHTGNYSDWLEHRKMHTFEPKKEKPDTNKPDTTARSKPTRLKFTYAEQREYQTIESDINDLEKAIDQVDIEMAASSSDFEKLQKLLKEKDRLEEELLYKLERWDYLQELARKISTQPKP